MSTDVAVVGFAQTPHTAIDAGIPELGLVTSVVRDVLDQTGIDRRDIGFTVSGSLDYLVGTPFSFVGALDAVGAWPPISESHVEMDAAWALDEAFLRMQHDDIDTALVYGFGKASQGDLARILTLQLDPYYLAPLGIDQVSLAALQARAYLDAGYGTEDDFAAVAERSRAAALGNTHAVPADQVASVLLSETAPSWGRVAPLRAEDLAPPSDGAAAVLLASGDTARRLAAARGRRPAWITGLEHRIDPHSPALRDLARSESAELAARAAGVTAAPVQVAELHAVFSHEELILRDALGIGPETAVNPSGGALGANPVMATGLVRIGEVAERLAAGEADRGVAHAAQGPCLQHNLVAVLEGGER